MSIKKDNPQQDEHRKRFGDALRKIRLERNVSLEELAEAMDVSPLTVRRLETAKAPVDLRYVALAARALDCSVENFLTSLYPDDTSDADILRRLQNALVERGVLEYEDFFLSGELMAMVVDLAKLPARDKSAIARLVRSHAAQLVGLTDPHWVVRQNLIAGAARPPKMSATRRPKATTQQRTRIGHKRRKT